MLDSGPWFAGFEARDLDLGGSGSHAHTGGRADAPPLLLLNGFPQTPVMVQDLVTLMQALGHERFFPCGHDRGGRGAAGLAPIEDQALANCERCSCRPEVIQPACEDNRASAGNDLEHDRASRAAGEKIACATLVLCGTRGVLQRLFDALALWRTQCAASVEGEVMPAGHFIPEQLPGPIPERLRRFFGG